MCPWWLNMIQLQYIGWLSVSIKTYLHNKRGASRNLNAFQEFGKIERFKIVSANELKKKFWPLGDTAKRI